MGAIGSAAPWFLTGWAHDVEIEFMIDTGCPVTLVLTVYWAFDDIVVIPPDSEIVAKFSVSGIRPHGCALVEPARCLIE